MGLDKDTGRGDAHLEQLLFMSLALNQCKPLDTDLRVPPESFQLLAEVTSHTPGPPQAARKV